MIPVRRTLRWAWKIPIASTNHFPLCTGIIGGVLTLASFQKDFAYTTRQATKTQSLAVSLQQAGAFAACLIVWPLLSRFGRKYTLALSSFIFIMGVMIETINTHSIPAFYVGRLIAGLGLGSATVIVPMYSSEVSLGRSSTLEELWLNMRR